LTKIEFGVSRSGVYSECCVIIDSDKLIGLSTEEKKNLIVNYAEEKGDWYQVESEDTDSYEVQKQ